MSDIIHLENRPGARSSLAPTLFDALAPGLREELLRGAPRRSFAAGAVVQQRGSDAAGFWVIERGGITVGQFLPDGDFRAIAVLAAGDSYGELAVLARNPRAVDAVAQGDSVLRWIDAARFEAALARDPASLRALAGALSLQLQEVLGMFVASGRTGSTARLAGILANLAGESGDAGPARVALGQQQLGELLGLTRVTVNRALAELEARGLVRRAYGAVEVLDREALQVLALA